MTAKRTSIHWLCLASLVAFIFYVLHDFVGGLYYPGYDRLRQAVSDLTAITAPSFVISNGLATAYGLFGCLGCVMVCLVAKDHANKPFRIGVFLFAVMNWVSGIGFSLFPLSDSGFGQTLQDKMHLVVTLCVVVLSIVSLLLIGIGALRAGGKYRTLAFFSFLALLLMFAGSVGVGTVPAQYFGFAERFGNYSAVTFGAVLGLYAFNNFGQSHAPSNT